MARRDVRHERPPARARLAARYAEHLYPGPLGRLVAQELLAYAETAHRAAGVLAESVVAEVLDSTPPAAALVPSSELRRRTRRAS
jgi:hypothetical protein